MISVVIPVLNEAESLPRQLGALAAQRFDGEWEVVIADNGSTDASRSVASSFAAAVPSLRVVDASAGRFSAGARNVGVKAATGDRLAFCDADDTVVPGWLAALSAGLDQDPLVRGVVSHVGAVTPQAWGHGQPVGPLLFGFRRFAPSCNMAVRRTVFESVGGFSVAFRYSEDVELSWRIQEAGHALGLAPEAIVYKQDPATLGHLWRQRTRWGRSHPLLFRQFRSAGMRRPGFYETLGTYAWLARGVRHLGEPARRRLWVTVTAERWGRLQGSVLARTWYP